MPQTAQHPARFAAAASRLAGVMVLRFGWTPQQFWAATPAELQSIFVALQNDMAGDFSTPDPGTPPLAADITRLMREFPDG